MVKRIFTLPVLFYISDDRKVFGRNRLITTNAYARFHQQQKKIMNTEPYLQCIMTETNVLIWC